MNQRDINRIASLKRVSNSTVDKDWVLGHLLNAFYSFDEVRNNFVFKGGTCLRKCYFEDYRFSEDLDFTLLDEKLAVDKKLFGKIIFETEKNAGIKLYLSGIKYQFHNDIPQGYEVKIKFWGADHKPNSIIPNPDRWQTKIKIDISFSEKMILPAVELPVIHPYPDWEKIKNSVKAYSLKEIVAEKIRSLKQRNRPRDIYDLAYLSDIISPDDYSEIKELLIEKTADKNIQWKNPSDFINPQKYRRNKRAWESSLQHHLPPGQLPEYDDAFAAAEQIVQKILSL